MAVEQSFITVPASDKLLDTTVVEQAGGTEVHREVVVLADPETLAAYAKIATRAEPGNLGLVVHESQLYAVNTTLKSIHAELQRMNDHLNQITELEDD